MRGHNRSEERLVYHAYTFPFLSPFGTTLIKTLKRCRLAEDGLNRDLRALQCDFQIYEERHTILISHVQTLTARVQAEKLYIQVGRILCLLDHSIRSNDLTDPRRKEIV